ncbi:MAG: ribonuclease III [Chloroflexi bacterium]|nr:ribonuclease III [Chloroflexota bacterium]
MANRSLQDLENSLDLSFNDLALLRQALVHRSYLHESPDEASLSNERLEFLGDAVLGAAIAETLYRRFPDVPEGRLTTMRADLVRSATLAEIAQRLKLGEHLLLGKGEEQSGGRAKERNLARTFEAVLGAVFLDQGYAVASAWALALFEERLAALSDAPPKDFKSRLQEEAQAEGGRAPKYRVIRSEGPDHLKDFEIEVIVDGEVMGRGQGRSKRAAQQEAARQALVKLRGES